MAGKHRLRVIAIAALISVCFAIRRDVSLDDEDAIQSYLVGSSISQSAQQTNTAKDEVQDVDGGDDSASENHMIGSSFSQSAQQALKAKGEAKKTSLARARRAFGASHSKLTSLDKSLTPKAPPPPPFWLKTRDKR
eukprot:TRINITY_DN2270_c0_g1_i2.p1 TRINITY_DN2270_c0_g1~~TRINITY_DN2270_c0_g1_i2.p1  ORF type:complete len:136 (+),score=17.31 TRINITY_DN2270_c0_g1_i2:84-491(+)